MASDRMGSGPSLTPEAVQAQQFATGFRGYDQAEVRGFLGKVAAELRALHERAEQLESMWHSAEERAARPPVLDEDSLMAAVGEETASILRTARTAAAEMRTKAGAESDRMVAEAQERSVAILAEAEAALARETAAAKASVTQVLEAARSEAAQLVDRARAEADSIRSAAQQERQLTIEGATATRERILEDLSRRRRVASVQIEQLRAGRERLIESYALVRRTLDEVQSELSRADAEARAAADAAGRRLHVDEPTEVHATATAAGDEAPAVDHTGEAGDAPEAAAAEEASAVAGESPPDRADDAPAAGGGETGPVGEARADTASAPEPSPTPATPVTPTASAHGGGGVEAVARAEAEPSAEASAPASVVPHLHVVPDPVETTVEAPAVQEAPAPPGSKVDLLFARIRAGRPEKARGDEPAGDADAAAGVAPDEAARDDEVRGEETDDAEAGRSDEDEALLQRREALVMDLEISLTRKLKRSLQDEQNDLLDRLRGLKVAPTAGRLLPAVEDQKARYTSAAQPLVDKAAAAGVTFAAELQGEKRTAKSSAPVVADLAKEAATSIVESLRRRLEQAISHAADDDQSVLVEAIGSAYREWKSQRIERISGDALAAAFSRGTWHHVPAGTPLRWVVEDVDGPCPDCDDDALAGSLPKGEQFPTGQAHPPAHSGCRCLLVPEPG